MEKINKLILISAAICSLASCSKDFLDRNSLVGLSENAIWNSQQNAEMGVNAIYDANREFTNSIVIYGMMDDFTDISYQSFSTGLTTGSYPASASFYANSWGVFYKGINRANTAIDKLPGIQMNEDTKNHMLGEAKFLRGYFYFKLWDYFGSIPLYDKPVDIKNALKPRNTDQEVYQFIVQDMTDAYNLLPGSYGQSDKGRATKWAALAMRGKAHLWAKEYEKAAADFKEIMDNSDRTLVSDYQSLFHASGNNNSEVIFDVQYLAVDGYGVATDRNYGNAMGATTGSQRTRPTPKLVNSYEMKDGTPFDFNNFSNANGETFNPGNPNDWKDETSVRKLFENRDSRMNMSVVVPWSVFNGKGGIDFLYKFPVDKTDPTAYVPVWVNGSYAWRKFVETGSTYTLQNNMPINIPLIRLADVILMYAEARNEALAAPDSDVYDAIDAVRERAGMPGIPDGLNQDQMRERIRHERMIELCGEGQRYSDIRRWHIAKDVVDGVWMTEFTGVKIRQRGFPERFYLWPIPQTEMDINPNLVQNPGWN